MDRFDEPSGTFESEHLSKENVDGIGFEKVQADTPYPSIRQAVGLYVLAFFLFILVGGTIQLIAIIPGLIITQIFVVLLPTLVFSKRLNLDIKKTLSLRAVDFKLIFLTGIAMIALMPMAVELSIIQDRFFPIPKYLEEFFRKLLSYDTTPELLILVFSIAILPGICEELLFRGFILSSLLPKIGKTKSVLITALMFGIFHLDPWRFMGPLLIGVLLGVLVVWTRSIYPAMFGHFINNLGGIILSSIPEYDRIDQLEHVPPAMLMGALVVFTLTLLLIKSTSEAGHERGDGEISVGKS